MSKKHNRNRLILARQILAVLAVVLFCVTLFSGYIYFFCAKPVPAEPEVTQTTAPDTFPTEDTATEGPTTEALTEPTETEKSAETSIVENNSGSHGQTKTGSDGSTGNEGVTGTPGGSTGNEGATGTPGGSTGNEGATGTPGGSTGNEGATDTPGGSTGNEGATGTPGGSTGNEGATDTPDGSTGNEGATGTPGGSTGNEGATDTPDGSTGNENPAALYSADLEMEIPLTSPDATDSAPISEPSATSQVVTGRSGVASRLWGLIFWCSTALLAADLIALLLVSQKIRETKQTCKPGLSGNISRTVRTGRISDRHALNIGTLHQPGRRQYQQDSLGHSIVLDGKGVLAVVADGMGGLADGDKVSQQIVLRTLELGAKLQSDQASGALYRILNQVNEDINQMLTPEGLYKCGSTMIAVLVQGRSFQWISVGDSRIYLYREGYVNRLNRDHDLLQEWMPEILSGQRSMEASLADPNARKLTSFIGMGRLKYVDGSTRPIDLLPGDRLLLLSDGVYGEIPEEQIAAILKKYPDVRQAAVALGRQVQANQNPHQDNYTALILGF